jgi:hypothetical protein
MYPTPLSMLRTLLNSSETHPSFCSCRPSCFIDDTKIVCLNTLARASQILESSNSELMYFYYVSKKCVIDM